MNQERHLSQAEAAVLDSVLPVGLTEDMGDVALCLFEALVFEDDRCGTAAPDDEWIKQLQSWAWQVSNQLINLADKKGGYGIYLPKLISVRLAPRDREMCAKFRGDYKVLAKEYNLTPMRVRQIVDRWQRERFAQAQGNLDLS